MRVPDQLIDMTFIIWVVVVVRTIRFPTVLYPKSRAYRTSYIADCDFGPQRKPTVPGFSNKIRVLRLHLTFGKKAGFQSIQSCSPLPRAESNSRSGRQLSAIPKPRNQSLGSDREPTNQTCTYCNARMSNKFCMCHNTFSFFCSEDMHLHCEKNNGIAHQIFPIEAYRDATSFGYQERFQNRTAAFARGKEELLGSISAIDKCLEEFESTIDDLIKFLRLHKASVRDQLQTEKLRLETAVSETIEQVESTLYQDKPNLDTWLSLSLRNYRPARLTVFQYSMRIRNFIEGVSKLVECQSTNLTNGNKSNMSLGYQVDLVKEEFYWCKRLNEEVMKDCKVQ